MSAEVLKTLDEIIVCPGKLQFAINDDSNITPTCEHILIEDGINATFTFSIDLTTGEETALDNLLSTFICPDETDTNVSNTNITTPNTGDQLTWDGTNWVNTTPTAYIMGSIFQAVFVNESKKVKNKWLSTYGDGGATSNDSPIALAWDCKLIALAFTNSSNDVSTNVEIYKASVNSGSSNTKIFTWDLNNVRTAWKTNLPDLSFSAGDKIAVFLKDSGSDPGDVIVTLSFQIIVDGSEENNEDFSGSF